MTLSDNYTGDGATVSVSITSPLVIDLNGKTIANISLNIGNSSAAPAVTIKDSGGNGQVNCDNVVKNAVNVYSGSLTIEDGMFIGDRFGGSGIEISGGSVIIQSGTIKGNRGIHFLGGSLTFDCPAGKTATIEGVGANPLSLANGRLAPVTVADTTRVKVGGFIKTAADLAQDVADTITIERRPAPPSITAPSALTKPMSDAGAYSGEFILAGDPLPIVNKIIVTDKNGVIQDAYVPATDYVFSWDVLTGRVKVLTGMLNDGDYTVTLTDTTGLVSCNWQLTITKFVVTVTADKPEAASNRYIIDPGESITFTADASRLRSLPTPAM